MPQLPIISGKTRIFQKACFEKLFGKTCNLSLMIILNSGININKEKQENKSSDNKNGYIQASQENEKNSQKNYMAVSAR